MSRRHPRYRISRLICILLGAILFWQMSGVIASTWGSRSLSILDGLIAAACGAIFAISIIELARRMNASRRATKDDPRD